MFSIFHDSTIFLWFQHYLEPPKRLKECLEAARLSVQDFVVLKHGESVSTGVNEWWCGTVTESGSFGRWWYQIHEDFLGNLIDGTYLCKVGFTCCLAQQNLSQFRLGIYRWWRFGENRVRYFRRSATALNNPEQRKWVYIQTKSDCSRQKFHISSLIYRSSVFQVKESLVLCLCAVYAFTRFARHFRYKHPFGDLRAASPHPLDQHG